MEALLYKLLTALKLPLKRKGNLRRFLATRGAAADCCVEDARRVRGDKRVENPFRLRAALEAPKEVLIVRPEVLEKLKGSKPQ